MAASRLPPPGVEFRLLSGASGVQIDLGIVAEKAHGEPTLPLAAKDGELMRRSLIRREVVGEPVSTWPSTQRW